MPVLFLNALIIWSWLIVVKHTKPITDGKPKVHYQIREGGK